MKRKFSFFLTLLLTMSPFTCLIPSTATAAQNVSVTVECKNTSTIIPVNCDYGYAAVGDTYIFRIITEPGLTPAVSINGKELTANSGLYSFTVEGDSVIKIDCGEADKGKPWSGEDYFGNDLTKYNEKVYLTSIWNGNVTYQETALFYTGRETVKLLYPVDEVISLRSYSLQETYIKGVDFDVTEEGYIKILKGSRIPVYTGGLTTTTKPSNDFPLRGSSSEWLKAISDSVYAEYAISVTYSHSTTFSDGYTPTAPQSQTRKLANTIAKLERGEEVNIVVFGDSISCGWSSSGFKPYNELYDITNTEGNYANTSLNFAPYADTWINMFYKALRENYPKATIKLKNLSLAGGETNWGIKNIDARLSLWKDENGNTVVPDLMLIGFGVNDLAVNRTTQVYKNNISLMVSGTRFATGNKDMEVLYFSPFLPNQLTATWDETRMLKYENALVELAAADEKAAVVKLTSIFSEIIKSKDAVDYLSTNWNHGNDFTCRQYATGILAAFDITYSFSVGDIDGDTKANVKDVITLSKLAAGWKNVTYNTVFADPNGDKKVNLSDPVHLARYLADWEGIDIYNSKMEAFE